MKHLFLKRLLAFSIFFIFMFRLFSHSIDIENTQSYSTSQSTTSFSPVLPNLNKYVLEKDDLSIDELKNKTLSEEEIPEILDNNDFDKSFHVKRLYEQEDDLRTFIFQNIDGSKSMFVYPFEVKQKNAEGKTTEKTLEVIKKEIFQNSSSYNTNADSSKESNVRSNTPLPTPTIKHPGIGDFHGNEDLEDGIEDVTILEGKPYYCTGEAYRTYVGYTTHFGNTKTYVRFPYLASNPVYERISNDQIINANYVVYKTESSSSARICVCLYTGSTWEESNANYTTPANIWSSYVFMTGMQYTEIPKAEGWHSFDITRAVKAWKAGGHSISQGLVLIGSTTQQDSLYGQEFYSVEGGIHDGANIPYVTITWQPEEQTTIQDGRLYAIKNRNGNYLTTGLGNIVTTEPKINVYTNNNGEQGVLEEDMFMPSQLWMVAGTGENVYKLYSVSVIDNNSKDDGFVLYGTNSNIVTVNQNKNSPKAKWIIEEYNNKMYLFNAEQDKNEYMLSAHNNSNEVCLSTDDRYAYWTFEEVDVTDTFEDITINPDGGTFFNFIVYDSAIEYPYTWNAYKAIENWNGISPKVTVRVYHSDEINILPADYTVNIKGYTENELISMYPDPNINISQNYAHTIIKPENYEQKLSFEIQINRSNLPDSFEDAKSIAMHEAGHALLLEHPDELHYDYLVASIMNSGSNKHMKTPVPSIYDQYNIKRRWD